MLAPAFRGVAILCKVADAGAAAFFADSGVVCSSRAFVEVVGLCRRLLNVLVVELFDDWPAAAALACSFFFCCYCCCTAYCRFIVDLFTVLGALISPPRIPVALYYRLFLALDYRLLLSLFYGYGVVGICSLGDLTLFFS